MSFKHIAFIGMVAISLSGTYLVSASAATNGPD